MSLRIAVTRAEPDASRTAARIDALGGEAVLAPLLHILVRDDLSRDLSGVQALLFTSANGVRAFGPADVRALAVGEATAAEARNLGYRDVIAADGGGAALVTMARQNLDPANGRVLHISGADIVEDIAKALAAQGFDAQRRIAYSARPTTSLPQALTLRLASAPPRLDRVLFHSARAAEAFLSLAQGHSSALTAVCMSARVANAAAASPWARILVADAPREDALLAAALTP